jgi:hypothetical protein
VAYYTFRIRQGSYSSDVAACLADDTAAWDEGSKVCGDLILTIIDRLRDSPEWRLEVVDGSGTIRHLFRLTGETFDP